MAVLGTNEPIYITPGADVRFPVRRFAGTQVLTLTGGATGGTFTLTYRGATTGAIAYNALGSAVQAALEALGTIKPHNVSVSGGAGGPWTVTPQGQIKVPDFLSNLITAHTDNLSGGSNYALTADTPLLDVSTGFTYDLQARTVKGSASPKIQVTTAGTPQGEVDMTDAASGILWVHIEDAATALLDFSDGNPPGTAHWVFMEIESGEKRALQEDGTMILRDKWYV